MDRCPCISARHGMFVLALCAYVFVQSKAFFGHSAFAMANAAHNGNTAAFLVVAVSLGLRCSAFIGPSLATARPSIMSIRSTVRA